MGLIVSQKVSMVTDSQMAINLVRKEKQVSNHFYSRWNNLRTLAWRKLS